MRSVGVAVALVSLLILLAWRPAASGRSDQQADPQGWEEALGHAELPGSLHLTAHLSPAVGAPGRAVTLTVQLTNRRQATATPVILLDVPTTLTFSGARAAVGTTFDLNANSFNWLPVIAPGETQMLELPFRATVADLLQPTQSVTLIVSDAGQEQRVEVPYWVGMPPAARITAKPHVVAVGQPVQLAVEGSGGGPYRQSWDLGDGRRVDARDPAVAYAEPGTYDVRVAVTNPAGTAEARSQIMVVAQPTAAFGVEDPLPVPDQLIHFINESGGQPPLSFTWDFGDGATSDAAHPTHQYSRPGVYEVRLAVRSAHGEAHAARWVTVGAAPIADTILPEVTRSGEMITGRAFYDDTTSSLLWDMGDGSIYEGEAIQHIYRRPGDYLVTLSAGNEFETTQVRRWVRVELGTLAIYLPLMRLSPQAVAAIEPPVPSVSAPAPASGEGTAAAEAGSVPPLAPLEGQDVLPPVTHVPEPRPPLPPQPPLALDASPSEQLLWYINEARRLHGLPPLIYSYELSIAAQLHTSDMAGNPDIMHQGSDGSLPAQRQRRNGYTGSYGGEAVAWGWESPVPVVEFWVNSPPHRVLLLNEAATEVGVGFTADGRAPNLWYWAAEFGIRP
ncbi:MAG: PKD domain-containing protein [Candidatus Promineifilaceae bacterium]|nr:PKD domain-containing protein [Candidatus Promineifilaceae bacterium]